MRKRKFCPLKFKFCLCKLLVVTLNTRGQAVDVGDAYVEMRLVPEQLKLYLKKLTIVSKKIRVVSVQNMTCVHKN